MVGMILDFISCSFPTFAVFVLCDAVRGLLAIFVHEVALQTELGLVLLVFKLFHARLSFCCFCQGLAFILCCCFFFFFSYCIICILLLFLPLTAIDYLFTITLEHAN